MMGRAAVTAAIAVLDATSLRRALSDIESWRLQKLMTTLRRYDASGADRVVMCGACGRRAEDPRVADCTSQSCGLVDRHDRAGRVAA